MFLEVINLKHLPYRVQQIQNERLFVIPQYKSFEVNKSLIVLEMSTQKVVLFSIPLGLIIKISLLDYEKYLKDKNPPEIVPEVLIELNLIIPRKQNNLLSKYQTHYFTNLQLNLTPDCNLRCKYCYAFSGRRGESQIMSLEIAKSAIDFVACYCRGELNIRLVGEGEATTQFELLKQIFNYAQSKISHVTINPISTNGVFSQEIADWLIQNARTIQISCDGPAFIQNKYRPLANGKGSSTLVEHTIKYLVKKQKDFRVRVSMVDEFYGNELIILNYFWQLGVQKINFGDIEYRGAAKRLYHSNKNKQKNISDLAIIFPEFQKLAELENELGMQITLINFSNIGSISSCGIYTKSFFVVDPYGNVSVCDHYTSPLDFKEYPFMKDFIIGSYDSTQRKMKIDFHKLNNLVDIINHQLQINNCPTCSFRTACSAICLYSLGGQYGTIDPAKRNCFEMEKLGPSLVCNYLAERYFINKKPCLEYKNNKLYYSLLYTDFELAISKNGTKLNKNPYIFIDRIDQLDKLAEKIIRYKNRHQELIAFLLKFHLKNSQINFATGQKITDFLTVLKQNKVYYKVTEPLPAKLWGIRFQKISEELDIPKTYKECLELYRVQDDEIYFSKLQKGSKKFSEYADREDIYQDFRASYLAKVEPY